MQDCLQRLAKAAAIPCCALVCCLWAQLLAMLLESMALCQLHLCLQAAKRDAFQGMAHVELTPVLRTQTAPLPVRGLQSSGPARPFDCTIPSENDTDKTAT